MEVDIQCTKTSNNSYATVWKSKCDEPLPTIESNSLGRLNNLLKKLQRDPEKFDQYHEIIQDQLNEGIVEKVTDEPTKNVYYIPHKPVIKKEAESMKMLIVYDASAKALESSPLLNDQFETGPCLQNLLWDVLVRNLFRLVALPAYVKQVFVQFRIQQEDRDSLRFHWTKDKEMLTVKVLRFTWALFGLVQSPFLLGATIYQHVEGLQEKYPSEVEKIE